MRSGMPLFNPRYLTSLLNEFRRSMRGLLFDLCRDLEREYGREASMLGLPVEYFRSLGRSLGLEAYSSWKVTGWVEELNDLVYFLDVRQQLMREGGRRARDDFAAALFAECERQFYEHHYAEDLFPDGTASPGGLRTRLLALCHRLAGRVVRESLWLVPGLPCEWVTRMKKRTWTVPWCFDSDLERAEQGGRVYVGLDGGYVLPPVPVRRELSRDPHGARTVFTRHAVRLVAAGATHALPIEASACEGGWRYVSPCWVRPPGPSGHGGLTLGDTLVYGASRQPLGLVASDPSLVRRLRHALDILERAWPLGASLVASLTTRVIPLRARGVVSFSYRNRPGLSFINTFDRDDLDLIDDLVHENSHHHMNLLLRKYRVLQDDENQEIFYSPWRRSLRPLRGIVHAAFTFTMGALLFANLSSCGKGFDGGRRHSVVAPAGRGFGRPMLLRARARGLEEVASVQYSLQDLQDAATHLQLLDAVGRSLTRTLEQHIRQASRLLEPHRNRVMHSLYGADLRRHLRSLERARVMYGRPRDVKR